MQHSTTTAIEFGLQALANAREQKDKYSEAVSAANLGIAFRPTAPGPTSRPNRTQPQPALREGGPKAGDQYEEEGCGAPPGGEGIRASQKSERELLR